MDVTFSQRWTIDMSASIGSGGFGDVYAASSDEVPNAVAKFVPKGLGANRDLLVEDLPPSDYLVPIVDSGEIADKYVLIMPRADHSLADFLKAAGGPLTPTEAVPILMDVARGLAAMKGVVHRDLKPGNVLMLNGHWAISDFGISRFEEATTAPDTHKRAKSWRYAAKERWESVRATPATDIYSLGVMAFEMVEGRVPFPGPTEDDYRIQHVSQQPPRPDVPRKLASLILECLYKPSEARPGVDVLLERLGGAIVESSKPGVLSLEEAQLRAVEARTDSVAQQAQALNDSARRQGLFDVARAQHEDIMNELFERIAKVAPETRISAGSAHLGVGQIAFDDPVATVRDPWRGQVPIAPRDVVCHATVRALQPPDASGYVGRSHALWFCDAEREGEFGWYETSFAEASRTPRRVMEPFALDPSLESGQALSPTIGNYEQAGPWRRIVPSDCGEFIDRWMKYLGDSSMAKLARPALPEPL